MKAILKTRCGCTQEIKIPFPAQPYIVLPLRRPLDLNFASEGKLPKDTSVTMKCRIFDRERYYGAFDGVAEYLERWQE